MSITNWVMKWGITNEALDDLIRELGLYGSDVEGDASSEAGAQVRVRLQASASGDMLWRNNVGACIDERGNMVRYGLANESKKMNKNIKSSDLIGIRPVKITQAMVGHRIGQFVAREVKRPKWQYKGGEREKAQLKFIELVAAMGGDAKFTTGEY